MTYNLKFDSTKEKIYYERVAVIYGLTVEEKEKEIVLKGKGEDLWAFQNHISEYRKEKEKYPKESN